MPLPRADAVLGGGWFFETGINAMNMMQNPLRMKAAATYDAASDRFDAEPLGFWARHGEQAVARLRLKPRAWVLDVGCGTGASALPAAAAVGLDGQVIGIDVADKMLAVARVKAAAQSLYNTHFEQADMTVMAYDDETFDAVVSVFSIFFVPDMERQAKALWRLVRPGGQLAVTVWGPDAFQPLARFFADELRRVRPEAQELVRPWERLTQPENLRALLRKAGAPEAAIETAVDRQPLEQAEDAWTLIMGSGYRWEVEQLAMEQRAALKDAMLRRVVREGVDKVETSALHAVARKPL